MPKLVDYGVRFAFLRQAAFDVVLHQGVGALSRRSVAAALGTSVNTVRRLLAAEADLVSLAAAEVTYRRRHGRMGVLRDVEPAEAAVHLLRKLLPDTELRVAEELVWLRILLDTQVVPEDRDRDGLALRERFRLAEGRYDDDLELETTAAPTPADPMAHHREERDLDVSTMVGQALDRLGSSGPGREVDERELRVVLAGLGLEVCLGRLTPDDAVATLDRTVRRLAPG